RSMRRASGRLTRPCCDALSRRRLLLPTRRCAAATASPFAPTIVRHDRREPGAAGGRVSLRREALLELLPVHPVRQNFPVRVVLGRELAAAGGENVAARPGRGGLAAPAAGRGTAPGHDD